MRPLIAALAALALVAASLAVADDGFKVVVHPDVSVDALSREQVSDIFLKRATAFPGGGSAAPVDQAEDSKIFEAFCQGIHGKPGSVVRAFWKRVAASGRDSAPPTRRTDDEVLTFVRTTRGGIGYVSAATATPGVKVIRLGN